MPTDFLYIDTNFPKFSGDDKLPDRVAAIQNYLFVLVEQLRYSLTNLDTTNWNQDALQKYGISITEPLTAQIKDNEGNITQLILDAKGLATRVSDAEGNISTLTQTAQGLQTTVTNQAGDISQLTQTANSLTASVSDLSGKYTSISLTVDGLIITTQDAADAANRAEGNVEKLAAGQYYGTFINGKTIVSPRIQTNMLYIDAPAGSGSNSGLTLTGYTLDNEKYAYLKIYPNDLSTVIDTTTGMHLYFAKYTEFGSTVRFQSNTTVDFTGANVVGLSSTATFG